MVEPAKVSEETVFSRDPAGSWIPSPWARGPFGMLQGGALAGLLCAEMEWKAEEIGAGLPAAITTYFLRPAQPSMPLTSQIDVVHRGRRVTILENRARGAGGDVAIARACFIVPAATPTVPDLPLRSSNVDDLPERKTASPIGHPWFLDTMDVRNGDGIVWFRMHMPLVPSLPSLARILGPADWAHGVARPDGWEKPAIRAIPNPEMSVHLSRSPTGQWTGLQATSRWRKDGLGNGRAVLWDEHGEIGSVSMAVVLVPFD